MLRTAVLSSALALGLAIAAPALAQDASGLSWTGPYAGLNIGYGGGNFRYNYAGLASGATTPSHGSSTDSSNGVLGGLQAGYNYQLNNGFVLGLETDIDLSDISSQEAFNDVNGSGTPSSGQRESRIEYLGTARGRIGRSIFGGRVLPYVTGGFAYGGVKPLIGSCDLCQATGAGLNSTQLGWTVGGGTEVRLSKRLSMKVEYLYANLGNDNEPFPNAFTAPGLGALTNASLSTKTTTSVIRVGLNYHF